MDGRTTDVTIGNLRFYVTRYGNGEFLGFIACDPDSPDFDPESAGFVLTRGRSEQEVVQKARGEIASMSAALSGALAGLLTGPVGT